MAGMLRKSWRYLVMISLAGLILFAGQAAAQYALTPAEITVSREGPYFNLRDSGQCRRPRRDHPDQGGTLRSN